MNRDWCTLGLSIACVLIVSCSTLGRPTKSDLAWDQKQYVLNIRWNEWTKNEQYVVPEDRQELGRVQERIGSMRISNFEINSIELSDDGNSASLMVLYTGYGHRTLVEHKLIERQEWYIDPKTNKWKFRPRLENIEDAP